MEIVQQLSVLAANQPGTLANICGMLRDENVNIRGITVADHVDHALVRMVVDDATRAAHLMGEAGLVVLEGAVIRIDLAFGPGSLEYVAEALGQGQREYRLRVCDRTAGGRRAFEHVRDD